MKKVNLAILPLIILSCNFFPKKANNKWDKVLLYVLKNNWSEKFEPAYFSKIENFNSSYFKKPIVVERQIAIDLLKFANDTTNFLDGNLATCFDEALVCYYSKGKIVKAISFSCNFAQAHFLQQANRLNLKSVIGKTENQTIMKLYKLSLQ